MTNRVFDYTQRLADFAFQPLDAVEAWLRRFPHLTVRRIEPGGLHVQHESGLTCGIVAGNPLDQGIAIAFAVLGPFWWAVVPDLIDRIDAEWHRRKPEPAPITPADEGPARVTAQGALL